MCTLIFGVKEVKHNLTLTHRKALSRRRSPLNVHYGFAICDTGYNKLGVAVATAFESSAVGENVIIERVSWLVFMAHTVDV